MASSWEGMPTRIAALLAITGVAGAVVTGAVLLIAERKRPLRRPMQAEPRRRIVNLALGAMSLATVALVEAPLTQPLAKRSERKRADPVQRLALPAWAHDAAGVLLMDYTIYVWHVATHKAPFLWRFHLVHHVDLDLINATALRFHGVDMAISAPVRAAQVASIGLGPRALRIWQSWFFLLGLFHYSNLRLPEGFERRLPRIVTTPRMHDIHHSMVREQTDSNWSSGFDFWVHLHRTFRIDVRQAEIAIGVPAYRDPAERGLLPLLALPFDKERDAWSASPLTKPTAMQ